MNNYRWPGNIRELENLIHSLVVTCDNNLIQIENLPTSMIEKSAVSKASNSMEVNIDGYGGRDLKDIMAEFETHVLLNAVKIHGSIPKAAKALNVNRTTVFRKLKRMGIEVDRK